MDLSPPHPPVGAGTDPTFSEITRIKVAPAIVEESETFIAGVENNFESFFPLEEPMQGTLELSSGEAWAEQDIVESNEWALGDPIELTFEDTGAQTFTLVGIPSGDVYAGVIAITLDDYTANTGSEADSQVYVKVAEGFTVEEGKAQLEQIAEGIPTVNIQTEEELQTEAEDQINQLLNLITGLLGLAVVIALIGVTNTMTLSVYERTHEIGLLRAVGLSRLQTRRMIRSEASIIAIFGAILGVVIGIFFGWAILQALRDQGFTAFVIPYPSVIGWILVTGLLGVLFALLPAWRASKLNVLEAIAYE